MPKQRHEQPAERSRTLSKEEKIAKALRSAARARRALARRELTLAREVGGLPARLAALSAVAGRAALDCVGEDASNYAEPEKIDARLRDFAVRVNDIGDEARQFAIALIEELIETDKIQQIEPDDDGLATGNEDADDPEDDRTTPGVTPEYPVDEEEAEEDPDLPPDDEEDDELDERSADIDDDERDDTTPGELPDDLRELERQSLERPSSTRVNVQPAPKKQLPPRAREEEELERGIVPPNIDPSILANA